MEVEPTGKNEKKIIKGDTKFFNLRISMVDGVTKKEWRTLWKKQALLYIYIIRIGVCGFEDIDRLYL